MVNLSNKEQNILVDSIIGQKLSVRDIEKIAKQVKAPNAQSVKTSKPAPAKEKSLNMDVLTDLLDEHLINYDTKENKIIFSFSNEEEIATFAKFFS